MRYLFNPICSDIQKKMVLLSGPRQCGKTTLAKAILETSSGRYFNWDDPDERKLILSRKWGDQDTLIVLDEIHKYGRWKNFLKGTYDTQKNQHRFLVTGSARLDIYKRGQDSMLGRFFSWRLHPFCIAERSVYDSPKQIFQKLLIHGGFPEPYLNADETFTRRWRKERVDLIFRQDIRELEQIRDLSLIQIFREMLVQRAGQLLVLSNIAQDLEISPKTAKFWLEVLERSYVLFSVRPYSKKVSRSLIKPPKIYFYDNGEVEGSDGMRFENLVATHLLKRLHFLEDSTGHRYELYYLRDKDGREVDFLVLKNRKPQALIEAKWSDESPSYSLHHYGKMLNISKCVQLSAMALKKTKHGSIEVIPAIEWLATPLANEDIFEV